MLIKKGLKTCAAGEKILTLFLVKNCGWVGLALDPPPHMSKFLWVGGFFGWVGPGRLTPICKQRLGCRTEGGRGSPYPPPSPYILRGGGGRPKTGYADNTKSRFSKITLKNFRLRRIICWGGGRGYPGYPPYILRAPLRYPPPPPSFPSFPGGGTTDFPLVRRWTDIILRPEPPK